MRVKRSLSFIMCLLLLTHASADDYTVTFTGDPLGRVNGNTLLVPKGTEGKLIQIIQYPDLHGYALKVEVTKVDAASGTQIQKGSTVYIPYWAGSSTKANVIEIQNSKGEIVEVPKPGNKATATVDFQIQSNADHLLSEKAAQSNCASNPNSGISAETKDAVQKQIQALQAYQSQKVLGLNPIQRILLEVMAENEVGVRDPKNRNLMLSASDLYQLNLRTANSILKSTALSPKTGDNRFPTSLVLALIQAESNFSPSKCSGAGACGLMQLMPATAKSYNDGKKLDAFDVEGGVKVGENYLDMLIHAEFKGNLSEALMGYDGGPARVLHALESSKANKAHPLSKETISYPLKVLRIKKEYDDLLKLTGWE
jgi:soluble lytic murein transglycosylase-like protein